MTTRWTLHRAGIVNVYQYGDEVLHFGGGRLLLRGVNGSGKSTAMNMLLPFLLDADTRRIDAAGEQSGVLASWMLTGRDDPQPSGYLWIEFRRPGADPASGDHDDFLVCGCGIRANRSTQRVTTWWFVTDRRPGIDVSLVEQRTPLTAEALRATLGHHAVFAQEQRAAYRNEVRAKLFGGADVDAHIRLLHVVRNPRVGDRIDVDLPEHLHGALPQLSDAALDDAAQPLEDLEEHRRNVEELTRTAATLTALTATYRDYARTELRRRAEEVHARFDHVRQQRRRHDAARAEADAATAALQAARVALEVAQATRTRLEVEIEALLAQPGYQEGQQLDDLRGRVGAAAEALRRAEQTRTQATRRAQDAVEAAGHAERTADADAGHLTRELRDLARATAAVRLPAAPDLPDLPNATVSPAEGLRDGLGAIRAAVNGRRDDIGRLHRSLDDLERLVADVRSAERAATEAEAAVTTAMATFEAARVAADEAVSTWRDALLHWTEAVDAIDPTGAHPDTDRTAAPDDDDLAAPLPFDRSLLTVARLRSDPDRADAVLDAAVAAHLVLHQRWVAQLAARRSLEAATVSAAEAELAALLDRREPAPPAQWWQRPDRTVTFAQCVDFAADLDDAQRAGLEAALEAAGLLGAEIGVDGAVVLGNGELLALGTAPVAAPLGSFLTVTVPETDLATANRVEAVATAVGRVLAAISVDLSATDAATAVSPDGSFRLGALQAATARNGPSTSAPPPGSLPSNGPGPRAAPGSPTRSPPSG